MKNKDLKKGKESTIGKIIYGFLLFMPLLAIFVTCGYAMFNKNAYKSYADIESTTISAVTNNNSIILGSEYLIKFENQYETGGAYTNSPKYYYSQININWSDYGFSNGYNWTNFQTRNDGFIYLRDNNNYQEVKKIWGTSLNEVVLTITSIEADYNFNLGSTKLYFYTTINKPIADVFYYAVDKVEQSSLFNWAENSLIYTGIADTCTQLSITNTFIPLLLAYWLIISVIYILYDIILMILIILHNKVHQIQDSI